MKRLWVVFALTFLSVKAVWSQQGVDTLSGQDSSTVIVDDTKFDILRFTIDSTSRIATVELTLTNLKETPRELNINVFGTQLVDNERNAYYFSTITLGRVVMQFGDKQNYLHYLLQPDTPVTLTITAEKISAEATAIELVKITFEDSTETGRFLDAYLSAVSAPEE
ncbi:hypothetical protein [Parapedobacter sp. DT-150]|uniref:hypothetical protein n=1 Tax=Parapedobacter sp. DT-150 TaxID=3396162 RepID=UPI003F1C6552